ncbi:hypothetical protein [Cryptosporangium phraense]|uniref:Uncharacterized protein n=1 Tax=Cryptosporangium phraense TaxID=2593070 RepID=A0A545AZX4_9ACTN|nr:hypothetical protein [Cryptosporangium phraense]TQS46859.1 hypothetical protein FL583_00850 [Cryptosporangium phraense]
MTHCKPSALPSALETEEVTPSAVAAVVRRSRTVTLAFSAAALAVGIFIKVLFVGPLRGEYWSAGLFLPMYAVGLVFFGLHVAMFWRVSRRRPAAFMLGRQRGRAVFVGPTRLLDHAALPYFAALAGGLLVIGRVPVDSFWVRAVVAGVFVVLAVVLLAVATWLTLFRRPFVTLSSDGLAIRWASGLTQGSIHTLSWDALAPGGPPPPSGKNRGIWLLLNRPRWPVATPLSPFPPVPAEYERFWIAERRIFIDPVFLAHAIRYYGEHPNARAGIGTQQGHDQLTAALRALHVRRSPADSPPW